MRNCLNETLVFFACLLLFTCFFLVASPPSLFTGFSPSPFTHCIFAPLFFSHFLIVFYADISPFSCPLVTVIFSHPCLSFAYRLFQVAWLFDCACYQETLRWNYLMKNCLRMNCLKSCLNLMSPFWCFSLANLWDFSYCPLCHYCPIYSSVLFLFIFPFHVSYLAMAFYLHIFLFPCLFFNLLIFVKFPFFIFPFVLLLPLT